MKYTTKSFARGSVSVEIVGDSLKYERHSIRSMHAYEAPLSEYTPVVERCSGTAWMAYIGAAVSGYFLFRGILAFSDWGISLFGILLMGFFTFYLLWWGRNHSGSYFIIRNRREGDRDIWILQEGAAEFVEKLRAEIAHRAELGEQATTGNAGEASPPSSEPGARRSSDLNR